MQSPSRVVLKKQLEANSGNLGTQIRCLFLYDTLILDFHYINETSGSFV